MVLPEADNGMNGIYFVQTSRLAVNLHSKTH